MSENIKKTPYMSFHESPDWCHLCGSREGKGLVDIWYSVNAEHLKENDGKYVRICADCIYEAHKVVTSK